MDGRACCKTSVHEVPRRLDLIVTDGHEGLLAALSELFAATPRQRCLVHKQRNVLNAIPRRERAEVQAELVGIWEQPSKQEALTQLAAFKATYAVRYPEAVRSLSEDEEHLLTFYAFPQRIHRHIQTTNAIESLFSNVRQRTDQIDVFTTETSCLTIVWATIQDIHLHPHHARVRLGDWSLLTSKQPAAMGGSGRGVFALAQPHKDVLFLLSWSVLETRVARLTCLLQSCQGRFTPCPHLAFRPTCFLRPCTQHSLWHRT
jgi:hypothetical protein